VVQVIVAVVVVTLVWMFEMFGAGAEGEPVVVKL
jgi:hypothetical protein